MASITGGQSKKNAQAGSANMFYKHGIFLFHILTHNKQRIVLMAHGPMAQSLWHNVFAHVPGT
jgi:hypothetical protein